MLQEEEPAQPKPKRKGETLASVPAKHRKGPAKVAKTTSKLINKWAAVRKDLVRLAVLKWQKLSHRHNAGCQEGFWIMASLGFGV